MYYILLCKFLKIGVIFMDEGLKKKKEKVF